MSALPTLLFTAWCTALSTYDLRTRRLPNALTLPGAAAALGYGFATGKPVLAVLGALLLALPYLTIHLCAPHALGAGDVKLALGLGAVTALHSPQTWAWAALAAPMLTAAAGVGMLLALRMSGSESPGETLAHGAAMCAASAVAVLGGP
ncbi:prepilin peptidase [Nocardia concava]|uniref:prepilin peptidase n=1 Tax=Nocardia concava TaxID=257281 RepID=UPI0003097B65|nr:A24 family peptidase [Nocardia concava]